MKIPFSWLQDYVDVPVEAERLGEDLTQVGLALDGLERHQGDVVLDVDVTTNRVDCMNVYGLAREVAVIYGVPLKPLALTVVEEGTPADEALAVDIEAADLCPRFCARVLDVRPGQAPAWMRERLEKAGVRSISGIVDLTNYVMLETGHPSHAFDLARVPEARLVVRWAREGERLATLDGVERTLNARCGVVASPGGALALAGIMGGATSEVSGETRVIALEAAYWDPISIRRAARSLGMHTEASHRFERGADPQAPPRALARIAHLAQQIGVGSVRPGLIDREGRPLPRRTTRLRPGRLDAVLGTAVPPARARSILEGLGFELQVEDTAAWRVHVPSWRGDVAREIDLVEEVARHHGLARIPTGIPPAQGLEGLRPYQLRERLVREVLTGAGLDEVIGYSFVPAGSSVAAARVANPLSEDQAELRTRLLPGLVEVLRTNLRVGRRDVRVFELGRVFHPAQPLPREERRLGVLLAGAGSSPHWSARPRVVDAFDAKGLLESLAGRLGWGRVEVAPFAIGPPDLHPGQSGVVRLDGREIGVLGVVHPDRAAQWELRDPAVVLEISLDGLLERVPDAPHFRSLPRFPAVGRDVSVLCDEALPATELLARIREAAGPLLADIDVVDRYDRPPVPPGRLSLTFSLVFQDPARTLTGDEVDAAVRRVHEVLARHGVDVRGE